MAKEGRLINCTNYFNDIGKKRLTEALEAGEVVRVYIDCIGHTRAYTEGLAYENWMKNHYGHALEIGRNNFGETTYKLVH